MADKRKSPSESEPTKRRPRGKTGRGDTFRDTERARQVEEGGEECTSAATIRGSAAKPAKRARRAASASGNEPLI